MIVESCGLKSNGILGYQVFLEIIAPKAKNILYLKPVFRPIQETDIRFRIILSHD